MIDLTEPIRDELRLLIEGTCVCGSSLAIEDSCTIDSGRASIAVLTEYVLKARDRRRCLCGAWRGRGGYAHVCYHLPGGPWVVARTPLDGDLSDEAELSIRDRMPRRDGEPSRVISVLPFSELDAACRLGQPLSAEAAWREALFLLDLGVWERAFPGGAGLRLIATHDQAREHTIDLLDMDSDSLLWLDRDERDRLARAGLRLFAQIDEDSVRRQVAAEALEIGLTASADTPSRLRVQLKRFATRIELGAIVSAAVARGMSLRRLARHVLRAEAYRLQRINLLADELEQLLSPAFARVENDNVLVLHNGARNARVDLGLLVEQTPDEWMRALTELAHQLGRRSPA